LYSINSGSTTVLSGNNGWVDMRFLDEGVVRVVVKLVRALAQESDAADRRVTDIYANGERRQSF
jgi:hypothetical protein